MNDYNMKYVESNTFSRSLKLLMFVMICCLFPPRNVIGNECPSPCTSKTCLTISSDYLSKFQPAIDPCDDFYGYVCGMYPEDRYIRQDDKRQSDIFDSQLEMNARLLKILEQEQDKNPTSISTKRRIVHESCVKFQDTEKEIGNYVKWLSLNVLPGWPYMSSAQSHLDTSQWLTKLYLAGDSPFFKIRLKQSMTAEMYPERVLLLDSCPDVERSRFIDFLYNLLETINVPLDKSAQIINDSIEIDDFLRNALEFHTINKDENSGQAILNCKMQTGENRWCDIFNTILETAELDLPNAKFKLSQPDYFDFIDKTLKQKSKSTIANYLAIRFLVNNLKSLQDFSPFLILPCRVLNRDPLNRPDINFSLDKRTNCLRLFTTYYPSLIAKDYMLDSGVEAKLEQIEKMLDLVKSSLVSFINSSKWMEYNTREDILFSVPHYTIGTSLYIDHIMSHVDYSVRYSDLSPLKDNFAYNLLDLKRTHILDKLKTYHLGYEDEMFTETNLFTSGAFAGMQIMIGFGFFEAPQANLGRPLLIDLSILGQILVHEIFHTLREQFNSIAQGNDIVFNHMEQFKRCMFEKYFPFDIPQMNIKVDSEFAYPEDLSDMLGIQLAYDVFKTIAFDNTSVHHKLPIDNISDEQMLFVAYGQQWCEFGDKEGYNIYLHDPHRPSMHRVNGPLKNFKPFVEAFRCPVGSNMNSGSDCKL